MYWVTFSTAFLAANFLREKCLFLIKDKVEEAFYVHAV